MTDPDFKDWMRSEIADLKNDMYVMRQDVREELDKTRQISLENRDTLRKYMWFWRGMKALGMAFIALVSFNWSEFIKIIQRLSH